MSDYPVDIEELDCIERIDDTRHRIKLIFYFEDGTMAIHDAVSIPCSICFGDK